MYEWALPHPELQSGGCGDAPQSSGIQLPLNPPAVGRAEPPAVCGDLPCQILGKEGRGGIRRGWGVGLRLARAQLRSHLLAAKGSAFSAAKPPPYVTAKPVA